MDQVSSPIESPVSSLKITDHIKAVAPDTIVEVSTTLDNQILVTLDQPISGDSGDLLRTSFFFDRDQARHFAFKIAKELHETKLNTEIELSLNSKIRGDWVAEKKIKAIKAKDDLWLKLKPIFITFYIASHYLGLFDGNSELFFDVYKRFNPDIENELILLKDILLYLAHKK